MVEISCTIYCLILVYLLELTQISFFSLTCLSNSGKRCLTTRSQTDSREPIPLHSCAVWALQFTCHVQTCFGHRCICTCCGSYERCNLCVRLSCYFVSLFHFCVHVFLIWSEITFESKLVSIYYKERLLVSTAGNNICVFGKVILFWRNILAEIVRFLDNKIHCYGRLFYRLVCQFLSS